VYQCVVRAYHRQVIRLPVVERVPVARVGGGLLDERVVDLESRTVATIFRTLIFPNFFQPLPKPKTLFPSKILPYTLYPIPQVNPIPFEERLGKIRENSSSEKSCQVSESRSHDSSSAGRGSQVPLQGGVMALLILSSISREALRFMPNDACILQGSLLGRLNVFAAACACAAGRHTVNRPPHPPAHPSTAT
jgi:hypothetical protein